MAIEVVNGMSVEVIVNSDTIALTQDLYLQTEYNSGAIAVSVGAASGYSLGLRFIVDNSRGVGDVNMNSGAFIIPAGAVYQYTVVSDGGGGKKYVQRLPVWLGLSTEDEVQLALNNAKATGKSVELAGGEIAVTETLTAPYVVGSGIRGKGATESVPYTHPLQGLSTRLVWTGDRTDATTSTISQNGSATVSTRPLNTLLHYTGGDMSLEQFALDGAYRSDIDLAVAKCPLGLLINRTGNGIGTGKIHARKLTFNYFKTAIQLGVTLNEFNCDESSWYDVAFNRCDVGMKTVNIPGMSHVFYNLRVGGTTTVFDYHAGGDLTCYRAFIGGTTTLLKFNATAGFGPNNAKYHFYGLKVDAQAQTSKLVDMPVGNYYADIVFDGLHVSSNTPTTEHMFKVADTTTLQVRNSKNVRQGMFRWNTTSAKSLIVVENCRLVANVANPATLFDAANSTGSCRCIVRNCILDDTNAVLNYDAVLTG
jgi:hypothetical protein